MNGTGIIIQARTGSSRLPGKVLKPIGGVTLLAVCLRRLQMIGDFQVVVATTKKDRDYVIKKIADDEGVKCFCGSETDVLDRYYKAAKDIGVDWIIRATADNPFVSVSEGRRLVHHFEVNNCDYSSNLDILNGKGLPKGTGLELFSFAALEKSWHEGRRSHQREHVNEYILENPNLFNLSACSCLPQHSCPGLSLTIDTPADYEKVLAIISHFHKPAWEIRLAEIIRWYLNKSMSQFV